MDGCLLGGRSAAIDPRIVRDEIGIVVAVFLILGHEPDRGSEPSSAASRRMFMIVWVGNAVMPGTFADDRRQSVPGG